jgi:pyridoxine 5'-phosphate synthase PdxJ
VIWTTPDVTTGTPAERAPTAVAIAASSPSVATPVPARTAKVTSGTGTEIAAKTDDKGATAAPINRGGQRKSAGLNPEATSIAGAESDSARLKETKRPTSSVAGAESDKERPRAKLRVT